MRMLKRFRNLPDRETFAFNQARAELERHGFRFQSVSDGGSCRFALYGLAGAYVGTRAALADLFELAFEQLGRNGFVDVELAQDEFIARAGEACPLCISRNLDGATNFVTFRAGGPDGDGWEADTYMAHDRRQCLDCGFDWSPTWSEIGQLLGYRTGWDLHLCDGVEVHSPESLEALWAHLDALEQ